MSIRNCRLRCGLSQLELAEMIYSTQAEVSLWERGEILPTIRSVVNLSEALDATVGDLLLEEPPLRVSSERLLAAVSDPAAVAAAAGFSPDRFRLWRQGVQPSLRTARRIAEVCGVPVSQFLEADE